MPPSLFQIEIQPGEGDYTTRQKRARVPAVVPNHLDPGYAAGESVLSPETAGGK